MWIFCKYGFFSAVQHKDKTDKLLIRARFEGDLERLAGGLPEDERKLCSSITETPHADYRFRMRYQSVFLRKSWRESPQKSTTRTSKIPSMRETEVDGISPTCVAGLSCGTGRTVRLKQTAK